MHATRSPLITSIARHPLFTPEEERAAFAALHEARVAAWQAVLSDRHLAPRCLPATCPSLAEHVVWDAAREAAVARPVQATLRAADLFARPLAERLAADDMRLEALQVAVATVGRLAPRRSTSPAWVRQVGAAMAAVHAAVDCIERHNLRLVSAEAFKFWRRDRAHTIGDLVGWGALGLRTAVLSFDLSRGLRFSTMARHWIGHAIRRAMQETRYTVALPVFLQERIAKVSRARDEHLARTGAEPTPADLVGVKSLKACDEKMIARAMRLVETGTHAVSLDVHARHENEDVAGITFVDRMTDPNDVPADEIVHAEERRGLAARLLGALDDRERRVVEMRYGLAEGGDEADLAAVGRELEVSRERARQIQKRALQKMQEAAEAEERARRRQEVEPVVASREVAEACVLQFTERRRSMQAQVSLQW